MAVCLNCQHVAPLPVRDLVRRCGELCPVEMALIHLRCEECQGSKVETRLVPFCERVVGGGDNLRAAYL
jgi:hypothetical protein